MKTIKANFADGYSVVYQSGGQAWEIEQELLEIARKRKTCLLRWSRIGGTDRGEDKCAIQ